MFIELECHFLDYSILDNVALRLRTFRVFVQSPNASHDKVFKVFFFFFIKFELNVQLKTFHSENSFG